MRGAAAASMTRVIFGDFRYALTAADRDTEMEGWGYGLAREGLIGAGD